MADAVLVTCFVNIFSFGSPKRQLLILLKPGTTVPVESLLVMYFAGEFELDRLTQAGVLITTYSMISFAGQRSEIAKKIIDTITNREWGFMLLDEVNYIYRSDRLSTDRSSTHIPSRS